MNLHKVNYDRTNVGFANRERLYFKLESSLQYYLVNLVFIFINKNVLLFTFFYVLLNLFY